MFKYTENKNIMPLNCCFTCLKALIVGYTKLLCSDLLKLTIFKQALAFPLVIVAFYLLVDRVELAHGETNCNHG